MVTDRHRHPEDCSMCALAQALELDVEAVEQAPRFDYWREGVRLVETVLVVLLVLVALWVGQGWIARLAGGQ